MSRCTNVSKWKWKCLSFLMFFSAGVWLLSFKNELSKMVGKWSLFSEFVYLLTDISLWRICRICHKYTEWKNVSNRIFLWVYICWKMCKISIWEMLGKWGHWQLYNCRTLQNSSISFSAMKPSLVFKNIGYGCLLSHFSFHFLASKARWVPSDWASVRERQRTAYEDPFT